MSTARPPGAISDHDLFTGVLPSSHHAEIELKKIINNGISIPPGDYEYRVTWLQDDHLVTEACLAGPDILVSGGRNGAWASGTRTMAQSGAEHISSGGAYTYVASFMRLHGDTYLSRSVFGTSIRWKDIWVDGADTVILMTNISGSNQTMKFYGLVWGK